MLLDDPIISQRYFFPRRDRVDDPFVLSVEGAELHGVRSAPHPDGPYLLHFHGNGEVVADWTLDFLPALNEAGINVVLAEYRGYGGSSGSPMLGAMLDDAIAWVDAVSVDPSRIVIYGRSVGSIYALHAAAARPAKALVIESGIADVLERLLLRIQPPELGTDLSGLQAVVARHLDHQAKVQAFAGPVLVLHARGDDLVPPRHAESIAAWAGERAALRLFDRGDHNTIHVYNRPAILQAVRHLCGV